MQILWDFFINFISFFFLTQIKKAWLIGSHVFNNSSIFFKMNKINTIKEYHEFLSFKRESH